METADNLKEIISRQREILSELETAQQDLENSDLVVENARLKAELEKLRGDFEQVGGTAAALTDENAGLKNALYEQIYNEKVRIINTTAQKLDIYFKANVEGELNNLTALENSVKARIDGIRATLAANNVEAGDELFARLDELHVLLDKKLTEIRSGTAQVSGAFSQQELDELEALKNEQITDDQIRAVGTKNNIERFVGLNVLNTIGVLLLVIGSITLARFTYYRLTDLLKGVLLFALGGIMLTAGEVLNRRKPNVFSLGISAGGIGILYAALATSFFALRILDMYPALALCVLITAVAFLLSSRYNSQTIAVFALVGGYLPMFSIRVVNAVTYGVMVYFIALNLLALLISFNKKWRVSAFIGLFLNIIGTAYICFLVESATEVTHKGIITILYVLFAFMVYTLIPIVSTYRTGGNSANPTLSCWQSIRLSAALLCM